MRGLSFLVDGELFAIDVNLVQKVIGKMTVTPVFSASDAVIGIANIKGRVVTILSLYKMLGHKERRESERITYAINAVVIKTDSGSKDQIGMIIEKPGELIDIDDDSIRHPSLTTDFEENFCISGIAEVGDRLYRIINIDAIMQEYRTGAE